MKKKDEEKPVTKISVLKLDNDLLEQGYNQETQETYYIRWNFKKQEYTMQTHVETDKMTYLPILDELLTNKAVRLPEEPKEYGTEKKLEAEIDKFIQDWLQISDEHRQKVIWYVMLTWIIDNLYTIPYLRALGDYGTGKTRYLDVVGGICYKPMFVGGAVRSAPIYRTINLWRGTAIFDEFTLGKSDDTEDIIQILNNGYERGKPVLRCKDGNYDKVNCFDPFGAKIIATRKTFNDKALESRCITEIMQTTGKKLPRSLTDEFFEKRQELQNKLLMFRFRNLEKLKMDKNVEIDFGKILPRVEQSLKPFTILFQYDKKRLDGFIQFSKEYNAKIVGENASSFDGQIFNAYMELYERDQQGQQTSIDYTPPQIKASDIRDYMVEVWGFKDTLQSNTISRHLHTLGFKTHPKKMYGKTIKLLEIEDELLEILRMKYVVKI